MITNKIVITVISIIAIVVIPVQAVTTFVLGLLASLPFVGFLILILFSIIWTILFLGPLLGLSYFFENFPILRPFISIIGIPLAVIGDIYVSLIPSMGEMESRYLKIIYCETFPYSWRFYRFYSRGLKISQEDILHKIFQEVSKDAVLSNYINQIKTKKY